MSHGAELARRGIACIRRIEYWVDSGAPSSAMRSASRWSLPHENRAGVIRGQVCVAMARTISRWVPGRTIVHCSSALSRLSICTPWNHHLDVRWLDGVKITIIIPTGSDAGNLHDREALAAYEVEAQIFVNQSATMTCCKGNRHPT